MVKEARELLAQSLHRHSHTCRTLDLLNSVWIVPTRHWLSKCHPAPMRPSSSPGPLEPKMVYAMAHTVFAVSCSAMTYAPTPDGAYRFLGTGMRQHVVWGRPQLPVAHHPLQHITNLQ